MSAVTFTGLGASEVVVRALRAKGITEPFAIQKLVLGDAIAGRDVIAKSPTGSGKTLAFGIPLVERTAAESKRPSALVLAPTRELATQIVDDLYPIAHSRALRIAAVYGGVGIIKQSQAAARAHIIVATPGRLEDLLQRRAFTLSNVRMLVLDEADRMLDMGFHPAIERIVAACPEQRQTLCFSATLDGAAGALAKRFVTNHVTHEHRPETDPNAGEIEHRFVPIQHSDRVEALVEQLNIERDLALVFVRTKHGADKLVKKLENHGVFAVAMHGNKTQRQRERALAQFDSGDVDTLVATDVAARGIDIDRISHVINFDPPDGADTYTHRVGRTGRAGRDGVGITLVATDQHREVSRMANELGLQHDLGGPAKAYMQYPTKIRQAPKPAQSERTNVSSANERPSRERNRSERPSRQRPGDERPSRERPYRDRTSDDRPSHKRPSRKRFEGPQYERGEVSERPSYERGERSERPSYERGERSDRPQYERGERSDRPQYERGERSERPSRERTSDDRPSRHGSGKPNPPKRHGAKPHADATTPSTKKPHRGQANKPKGKNAPKPKHEARKRARAQS